MKTRHASAFLLAALVSAVSLHADAGCACCAPSAPAPQSPAAAGGTATAAPAGHPLRGVVVGVIADKQALLVKHEEIPGVMKAMTMLLKTDAATLAAAKKDQAITATLVRKDDGWWIENVAAEPVPTPPASVPAAPAPTR